MSKLWKRLRTFFDELKRRRVFRVATSYVIAAWIILQLAEVTFDPLRLPEWALTLLIVLVVAGFPIALILAWALQVTPEGIEITKSEDFPGTSVEESAPEESAPAAPSKPLPPSASSSSSRAGKFSSAVLAALRNGTLRAAAVVVLILLLGGLWYAYTYRAPAAGTPARRNAEASLAVMYFKNQTSEENLGRVMTDMLTTSLGRRKDLHVVSSQRLFDLVKRMGKQDAAVLDPAVATEVAQRAGVERMLTGRITQIGERMRITAQLTDVQDGTVLASVQEDGQRVEDAFDMADRLTKKVRVELRPDAGPQKASIADVTTGSYEAYKRYRQGSEDLWRFRFEAAIKDFEAALALDSTFAMAYHHLALAKVRTGLSVADPFADLTAPREAIDQALRYAGETTERERMLIRIRHAFLNRNFKLAARRATEAIRQFPDDVNVLFSSSFVTAFAQSGLQARIPALKRILEIDPSYAPAHNHLGYEYAGAGEFEKAIKHMQRYRALFPDVLNAYDSAWEIYMKAGRFEKAYRTADSALQKRPRDWASAHYMAGWARLLQDRPDEARAHFQKLAEAGQPVKAQMQRGHALVYGGRYEEALRTYRNAFGRARREDAQWWQWAHTGHIRRMQGRPAEARKAFAKMAAASDTLFSPSFNPGRIYATFLSGLTWARQGRVAETQKAVDTIRRVIAEQGLDDVQRDYVYLLQAALHIDQRRGEEALDALERVSNITVLVSPFYGALLPAAHAARGAPEQTIASYERFANDVARTDRHGPGTSIVFFYNRSMLDYRLGRLYEQTGKTSKAVAHYRAALDRWQHADRGLPTLQKVRRRLAQLHGERRTSSRSRSSTESLPRPSSAAYGLR